MSIWFAATTIAPMLASLGCCCALLSTSSPSVTSNATADKPNVFAILIRFSSFQCSLQISFLGVNARTAEPSAFTSMSFDDAIGYTAWLFEPRCNRSAPAHSFQWSPNGNEDDIRDP